MSAPLLRTKLYIPPMRPGTIARPRLVERLNEGLRLGHRLALLSAPAGFGKTTLLCEWIAQGDWPSGWISLDERDNDPTRFLSYLAAALQSIADAGGAIRLALPQPSEQDAFLAELVNVLHELPAPLILVLDDYHLIAAEPIHEAVTFVLDYAPPSFHLVVASRADPPLPIARLRGRGQITELRQRDLRFTIQECSDFIEARLGPNLSEGDISALSAHTEGWVAGLQMAAQSLRGRTNLSMRIADFAGSHRFVLDYLIEEVLGNETAEVQRFLLHTSILEQLCGPLCDALLASHETGLGSGQAVLEHLERANLFVVPLDDRREWYRYHRLFGDLLRHRLSQMDPARLPMLHHRASCWYQEQGMPIEAIDHALQGQDLEWAADLIEEHAEETLLRGEMATFDRWMDILPSELALSRPSLPVFRALVRLLSGRQIDDLASHLPALEGDVTSGGVALLHALLSLMRGQVSEGTDYARQALGALPANSRLLRGIALSLVESIEADRLGRLRDPSPLRPDLSSVQRPGEVMVTLTTTCSRAEMSYRQGQLHPAHELYTGALELATTPSGERMPIGGGAMIGLADLAREWNQLDRALRYAQEGVTLSRQWSELAAVEAYLALARIEQTRGDLDAAGRSLQQAREIAVRLDVTDIYVQTVNLIEAGLWIAQGDLDRAWAWAEKQGLDRLIGETEITEDRTSVPDRIRKYELVLLARLLLAGERHAEALSLLDALYPTAERRNRPGLMIEIHALRARAHQAMGHPEQSMAALGYALALAEPEGYMRVLLDEGKTLCGLLQKAIRKGISPAYARRILAALDAAPADTAPDQQGLVEPLTDRELDILRLLQGPLSSTEIANELVISANTVRYHIKNIYGKLGAHSRSAAVDRARELGLFQAPPLPAAN